MKQLNSALGPLENDLDPKYAGIEKRWVRQKHLFSGHSNVDDLNLLLMPDEIIQSLLDQLNIRPRSVTRLEESSFASKVYRIDTDTEKMVLKLFHGRREYWREFKTLELLAPSGQVPRVLDGIPSAEGFDGALLLEYIENENLASSPIDKATAFSVGVSLAKIHEHSLGTLGFFGPKGVEPIPFNGWWSFRRHLLTSYWAEIIENKLESNFVQRCCDRIFSLSESFDDQEPTCLIHCDFRFGNVLKRGNGELTIIDFESSREGDSVYDFIRIWEQLRKPRESQEWNLFLEGYTSVRTLPANLTTKLEYYWFDLNFGFLYWAIDRGDEPLFQNRLKIIEKLLET